MAINFNNNISQSDFDALDAKENPPEYEPGFESSSDDSDFDSIFDDDFDDGSSSSFGSLGGSDSTFGSSDLGGSNPFGGQNNSNPFGGSSTLGGQSNPNPFGGSSTFGSTGTLGQSPFGGPSPFGGQGQFGQSPFGNPGNNNGQAQQTPDTFDSIYNESIVAAKSFWNILVDVFKSVKTRTYDDLGYFSRNLILTGFFCAIGALVLGIIGNIVNFKMLKLAGLPFQVIISGLLTLSIGLINMGIAAIAIAMTNGESDNSSINNLDDVSSSLGMDDATDTISDSIGTQFDSLFNDDDLLDEIDELDDITSESEFGDDNDTDNNDMYIPEDEDLPPIDYSAALENIHENQLITRELLVNTFIPLFPINTPGFADSTKLTDGDEFKAIKICVLKALANVARTDLNSINSDVESIESSFFSYTIKATRVRGITKLDEIGREVETYMRENSDDTSVNATVTMEGDYYKIIVTKGATAIVTFGDVFKQDYVKEFFLKTKNKLPVIQGIDELGNVLLADAKIFDTMLIAGKPRSGKSWYVLSIIIMLMLFNTPEDVQFLIIDPKESNLFQTIALMPHVFGLHNNSRIIQLLDDVINVEAPRRKKLFKDNRVDDIWALRDKGIKLPIIYIIIDEYITVRNDLGDEYKELDRRLQVLISQLPSQGIRLLFVPHRATGIVDKTNRSMLQFTAAVKASTEDVMDTLDTKKWTRPLVNPGDIAIKSSSVPNASYVRGAALTTSDSTNTDFIINAAKAFYKMGVELPDMTNLTIACNRDEEYIKNELGAGNVIQYDANTILDDLD